MSGSDPSLSLHQRSGLNQILCLAFSDSLLQHQLSKAHCRVLFNEGLGRNLYIGKSGARRLLLGSKSGSGFHTEGKPRLCLWPCFCMVKPCRKFVSPSDRSGEPSVPDASFSLSQESCSRSPLKMPKSWTALCTVHCRAALCYFWAEITLVGTSVGKIDLFQLGALIGKAFVYRGSFTSVVLQSSCKKGRET